MAKKIAEEMKTDYSDEHLREVYNAAVGESGDKKWIHEILKAEYSSIRPSHEVSKLFNYPWYRIYTLNIDDSLQNTAKSNRVQDVKFVNGVNSDRSEWAGRMSCQVVHLHGMATEIESGVVFADEEYAAVYERRLGWYQQLREDFRTRNVYIIGSQLDEPFILSLIQREEAALKDASSALLIVPTPPTAIRQKSLARAKISHLKGTLADFTNDISHKIGPQYSPTNIVAKETNITALLTDRFSSEDVPALQSLYMLDDQHFARLATRSNTSEARRDRARFFEGYGPNWAVIADPAYAELRQYQALDAKLDAAIGNQRAVVLRGEAGSGKSTYLYRYAARAAKRKSTSVFQYRESTASFNQAMEALRRFIGDAHAIVLVDDLRVYAEDVSDFIASQPAAWVTFVMDARASEWAGHLGRLFSGQALVLEFDRFQPHDVDKIIDVIEKKHVAPIFNKLSVNQRKAAFNKSRKQLLFAIREASQSKEFDQIIADEVKDVGDPFARCILLLISFATLARTGLRRDVAASISEDLMMRLHKREAIDPFSAGLSFLPGMVDEASNGLLRVRHDSYASIVLGQLSKAGEVGATIEAVVDYFGQFETPIISNINKMEAQLFKYSLNNRNIFQTFNGRQSEHATVSLYAGMEQRLQLDGHFWLQYGLLLRRFGRHDDALGKFQRSIEAYDNDFARHALAQQQLIIAATVPESRKVEAAALAAKAEVYLMNRHNIPTVSKRRMDDSDYPISVLGHYHIDALVHLGRIDDARERARAYYNLISEMEKRTSFLSLAALKERLMLMGVNGIWERNTYKVGEAEFAGS